MGFFGSGEPLSGDFEKALVDGPSHHRRLIEKGQRGIREALVDGESLQVIAVEDYTATLTLVVTDQRLLVMRKGGRALDQAITAPEIRQTVVNRADGGAFVLVVEGPRVIVKFHRAGVAYAVAEAIDKMKAPETRSVSGARTVPTLYPDFYVNLMVNTGMPDTPDNRVNLIERIFVMVQGQAAEYFQQAGDIDAQRRFAAHFDGGGPEDRVLYSVDDMVDWLWAWSPFCHDALEGLFPKITALLLEPHSFLYSPDGKIVPWSEWRST